jgi:predicted enzyme related to lactoylglutathione lyase
LGGLPVAVMRLAKPRLDFGLYTNKLEEMLAFWQGDVGLRLEEMLPAGRGVRQHRHALNGSVFKLNHSREPLPAEPPSGYRELLIARQGLRERLSLVDPDGNRVTLVPPGEEGIEAIGIRMVVNDPAAHADFFGRVLEWERVEEHSYRMGDTLLLFDPASNSDADREPRVSRSHGMQGVGYRYFTVQVWDVDAAHAEITSRGGEEAHAPLTLGKVARISFVRDPDGNWIELSQRASLTGDL